MSKLPSTIFWATVLVLACLVLLTPASRGAGLPDLQTGGQAQGPVAILFLGPSTAMDKQYAAELTAQGATFANVSFFEPLPDAFLQRFNVFVFAKLPFIGEEFDVFGQKMLTYWANMRKIRQCAKAGAGILVYVNITDGGGANTGGWNKEMLPWGVQIQQACIRDGARKIEPWMVYGGECYYSWTENLAKHPVTDGLKRVYWPSVNMRWDDCYAAPPLVCDMNWTALVQAMPGATVARQIDQKWVDDPQPLKSPVLCAVRQIGKGRMAVLSIHPYYTHQMGYAKLPGHKMYGEMAPGLIDGIILKKGDGTVPSDTGALVSRLYAWLAGNSMTAGFGGYRAGDPILKDPPQLTDEEKNFKPVLDFEHYVFPPSWRHRGASLRIGDNQYYPEVADPLVTGPLRFFKALIGARTKLSDGKGTVADYAKQAKKAGYSLVVFTETFEKLTRANWDTLVAQCTKYSTDDFICLPGYDIQDPDGNHFVLIAPPELPRASWLTADGTRLEKTQMINFLFYNHLVVVHRSGAGPLPYQRLKHFQGLSVYTYRNGTLVDDGLKAYQWMVESGSNPHPIVVHELTHPSQVAQAAKHGFQQLMPSDTVRNAVAYFRIGTPHFFEAPARYMISEGPLVHTWVSSPKDIGPMAENRDHFRVAVGVRSDVPLVSVELYDGHTLLRRWLPNGTEFQAMADFQHSRQYALFIIAEDARHRRVMTNSIRTVAERYHYRCSDRQNWLADVGFHNCYTGAILPDRLDIMMPVKGTAEGSQIFTNVPGTSMAQKISFPFTCNDVVVQDVILDEKYTKALFADVGLDAMPSRASQPSEVYTARRRNYSFTPGRDGKRWIVLTEYDITLKRDVEPVNPAGLFPAFSGLRNSKLYQWDGAQLITGELTGNTVDLTPGMLAGGYIVMGPGLQVRNEQFGVAGQRGALAKLPAGTHFTARFLYAYYSVSPTASNRMSGYSFDDDPQGLLSAMGFAGPTPYQLTMTRGKLDRIAYLAEMTPERYGVAGVVTKTAELLIDIPMQLRGVNPNWPAGLWRDGGTITYTGVFEKTAWPRLDVSKSGKFYAGNLLTADNPNLVLEFVRWTKDAVTVEVHNPTAKMIEATVSTPTEIANYKPVKKTVAVPSGSTIYLTE